MPSVFCLSLGCFKNRADSERLLGELASCGYTPAPEFSGADVCVINTCGFIQDAVTENVDAILDAARERKRGAIPKLVVFGCLVNRYGAETLAAEIPEVDAWIMCEDYAALKAAAIGGAPATVCGPAHRTAIPSELRHVRYLKVSEGCSNRCSYCMIPAIRGEARSVPVRELVSEAQSLAEDGAREICLVGQDLAAYGEEVSPSPSGGSRLIELLDALESSLPKDIWIRLLYLQPMRVTRPLLERIAAGRQILHYIDIPIQHANDRILRSMGRSIGRDRLAALFREAREIIPDVALRTTCMVGYPGETREEFKELLRFLEDVRFDRAGAFIFSPEEGTPAAEMPAQVPKRTKERRLARLMELQEDISAERQALFVGRELDVMIDAAGGGGDIWAEGRSYREAPEVDGLIEINPAPPGLAPGDVVRARVTAAFEHDLAAEMIEIKNRAGR